MFLKGCSASIAMKLLRRRDVFCYGKCLEQFRASTPRLLPSKTSLVFRAFGREDIADGSDIGNQ
jgi:hypothetical protein